ncbi:MAG: sigma-54 dependent transcriptional regulator, partial [Pseudomonadota bacterium]
MDGAQLMQHIRLSDSQLPVILMTAFGTIDEAVSSMLDGASHYLVKPFDMAQLLALIDRLLPALESNKGVIASDPAMLEALQMAALVAQSDATVTISGESGTGKEVVAREIHRCSPRRSKDFVAINCAAIPDNMLEAVLFGHNKGAFTGATHANPGKFELAQGSTLLLDEVTEMDLSLQAKLLRVLQEKEVERIGSGRPISLDVRVLATTNRDFLEEVQAGRFREDLYYRLNVFPLALPALRDRPADIRPLTEHFLAKHRSSATPVKISDEAQELLGRYRWPGNVRELENVLQRSLILSAGKTIDKQHLIFPEPIEPGADACDGELQDALLSQEHKAIVSALQATTGNRSKAAERLGISPRTLRYKMARLKKSGARIPDNFAAAQS